MDSLCLGSDIDDIGVWLVVPVEQPVDGRFDLAAVGTPHLAGVWVDAGVKDDDGLFDTYIHLLSPSSPPPRCRTVSAPTITYQSSREQSLDVLS
ncbi:2731_t:CDS:2 [Acaulospora colombiana]|uniref:2731_t:CDS:1 n=1 Tax=Acaulospora colombiana TaxID=27376 RepID=A0ACA9NES3_9GLOM|nr:2731_t:CDS:2 [Acaulospora colombiana]